MTEAPAAPAPGAEAAVRAAALRLLGRREHSREELRRRLRRSGHPEALVERVLEALAREGLQDDRRFAEAYARSRRERGYGPLRVAVELRQRGVARELVERVLAEQGEEEPWEAALERARRRRFGAAPPRPGAERARQARFLQQRGFPLEQVLRALGAPEEA